MYVRVNFPRVPRFFLQVMMEDKRDEICDFVCVCMYGRSTRPGLGGCG